MMKYYFNYFVNAERIINGNSAFYRVCVLPNAMYLPSILYCLYQWHSDNITTYIMFAVSGLGHLFHEIIEFQLNNPLAFHYLE